MSGRRAGASHGPPALGSVSGRRAGAFQVLLDLIGAASDPEEREALRQRLVDLFRVAGATPEVKKARTLLSMLLM